MTGQCVDCDICLPWLANACIMSAHILRPHKHKHTTAHTNEWCWCTLGAKIDLKY